MARKNPETPGWRQYEIEIAPNHGWRARPGYKVFSWNRGDLLLEVPGNWIFLPGIRSVRFKNRQPPKDDVNLEISVLPSGPIDNSKLPILSLLQGAAIVAEHPVEKDEIIYTKRINIELAWYEYMDIDPDENKPCVYRTCIARGSGYHALISYAFWPELRHIFSPIWENVLESIQFGVHFDDPSVGPVLH